jgi:hypothetical protein
VQPAARRKIIGTEPEQQKVAPQVEGDDLAPESLTEGAAAKPLMKRAKPASLM